MAKNFGSANSARTFKEVAKASAEKAHVITIKMIFNDNLIDYSKNDEDITETTDLENSIKELGFTDPIEVTSYGQSEGKYMIVSGHRRRAAGVKCGLDIFPCIVKSFNNDQEINNYVLLANSQRDSSKDPLLFCKRYKMHEEYLKAAEFKGRFREEIAIRLGISIPQADRYNMMNKVIMPVWDLVRDEVVGMSSVLPMASHSPKEQTEIYNILEEAKSSGVSLTRDTVKLIVDGYREGKRTWVEVKKDNKEEIKDSGLPVASFLNTDPGESKERNNNRNNEIRREFDPIAAEAERADAERKSWENQQINQEQPFGNEEDDGEQKSKKVPLTEEEQHEKRAKEMLKNLEKLNNCFSDIYTFSSDKEAGEALQNMTNTFSVVVDEMYEISREHNLKDLFKNSIEDIRNKINAY